MNLQLTDRIALVTGGSKGIGEAIVRALVAEGVRVAFCARSSAAMADLAEELTAQGHACLALPVDAFDPATIAPCVATVVRVWGGLDLLVNNLGGAIRFAAFEDLTDEDWVHAHELNVLSVVRFTRAALPHLRRSTLRRIVNVSSLSALQPGAFNPHYTATKAAVVNLSKHLANVLAKEKILVNAICPGPVHSESWQENVRRVAQERGLAEHDAFDVVEREEANKVPLGVIGDGAQIGAAVAWLASPLSGWTTGSCLHIDGGKLAAAL
jgi:3-oxoacyl-[acyl-carrier protein] reductase